MTDPSHHQTDKSMGAPRALSGLASAALAVLVAGSVSGCGLRNTSDDSNANVPPINSAPLEPADFDSAGQIGPFGLVTVGSGPSRPVGAPISPTDDFDSVRLAVEQAHGPTSDVAAQMARFGQFPAINTPPRTEIVDLRSDVRISDDSSVLVTSEVSLMIDGDLNHADEFFRSEAARLGWTSVAAITTPASGSIQTQYEIPGSLYLLPDAKIELWPVDAVGPANQPRSLARIRYTTVDETGDMNIAARYGSWASAVPLPEGGQFQGAGVQTSAVGRRSLHLTVSVRYLGVDAASMAKRLRTSMTQANFTVSQVPTYGDKMDHWIYFESPQFTDARVTLHEPTDKASIGQWTVVNVDTRVDFHPYSDLLGQVVGPTAPQGPESDMVSPPHIPPANAGS